METLHALVSTARFNVVSQIHWSFNWFKLDSKKGFKPEKKKNKTVVTKAGSAPCANIPLLKFWCNHYKISTLELWSPDASGSKKQIDLRRVWQIQFDRFPHKTHFVFFLPILCNQITRTTFIKVCWAKMVIWINIAGPIICAAIEEV